MSGTFKFGPYDVKTLEAFFTSKYSLGLVNFKPVVPGHVLVIPRRVVPRFSDLTSEEVSDLFQQVQKVGNVIEKEYESESLTITMQDGTSAGQTVPHVHVHIIPRKKGDWMNNDDIYPEIEKGEKELQSALNKEIKPSVDNDDRPERSMDDMAKEASNLRKFFNSYENIWK